MIEAPGCLRGIPAVMASPRDAGTGSPASVTVTGHAEGYADNSQKVKLEEGTTKEIEIVIEKSPAKKGDEKK